MVKKERLALVTGASRGLGRAVALGLAEAGYKLAIMARSKDALATLSQEITAKTGKAVWALPVDISKQSAVAGAIQSVIEADGPIDVLVNNAGIVISGDSEISAEDFAAQIEVNLLGAFYCAQAVIPQMKAQQSGYIFNIASTSAKFVKSTRLGYGASKYGMLGMSEGLYHDLAKYKVKVTALCPRYMPTDMTKESGIKNADKIPLSDIVKTILYCLSLSPSVGLKDIVLDNTVVIAQN